MGDPLFAVVEPWCRESHKAFVEGLLAHSRLHPIPVTGNAPSWQWTMRAGALDLAAQLESLSPLPDVFLFSDYVNLPATIGFFPALADKARILYFHENQLTYPIRKTTKRSPEFGIINVLSAMAATRCVFCSRKQMDQFLDALLPFAEKEPTLDPVTLLTHIEDKSSVIPAGVDFTPFDRARETAVGAPDRPLEIVWPHRFNHDKNPEEFFELMLDLAGQGFHFHISVIGREYPDSPPVMEEARTALGDRVLDWGMKSGDEYARILGRADVVVSTAWQETLGLAVIEAIRAGCHPLLPNRLSYPEVIGDGNARDHLYTHTGDLRKRLRPLMENPTLVRNQGDLWKEMDRFSWDRVAPRFDALARALASGSNK